LSVGFGELPSRLRLATLLAVLLSGLCGLFSAWEAFSLVRFSELKQAQPPFKFAPDPVLAEQLRLSQVLALEQMREPRMVVLFALALVCSLGFVASTRLLRPAGLPREGVRRILVWTLVVAAALRTIDGAQSSAVARSTAEVLRRGLALPEGMSGAAAEQMRGLVAPAALVAVILQTALVVGPFILLSQYFRSPRVKEWVATADARST
jgi:hypothetical protein